MFIVVGPDRPIDLNAAPRPERVSRVHSGMVPTTTMGGISTLGTLTISSVVSDLSREEAKSRRAAS